MTNEIKTGNYNIYHTLLEPSKMMDYDYDPDHPDRRYYATYLHVLHFNDGITNSEILGVEFTSETWANVLTAIYRVGYVSNGVSPVLVTIDGIHLESYMYPAKMLVYRNPAIDTRIHIDFMSNGQTWMFDFAEDDIEKLVSVLEVDDIENLYVTYSSDRNW